MKNPTHVTVVECIDGVIYVYCNTWKHYQVIKQTLSGKQLSVKEADNECNTSTWGQNWHMAIPGQPMVKIDTKKLPRRFNKPRCQAE